MATTKHFEPSYNEPHSEFGESYLDGSEDFMEYSELCIQGKCIPVVVKKTAKNVAVLNDHDALFHKIASDAIQNPLEKVVVVIKLERQLELKLEPFPDGVVFAIFRPGG